MVTPSPRKPRRKASATEAHGRAPTFPLASIMWPARSSVSQWEILPLILMAVGLLRWAAGLWGYSGRTDSPRLPPTLIFSLNSRVFLP